MKLENQRLNSLMSFFVKHNQFAIHFPDLINLQNFAELKYEEMIYIMEQQCIFFELIDRPNEPNRLHLAVCFKRLQVCEKYSEQTCKRRDCPDIHLCINILKMLPCKSTALAGHVHTFSSAHNRRLLANLGITVDEQLLLEFYQVNFRIKITNIFT
jgi:hypothetical protein